MFTPRAENLLAAEPIDCTIRSIHPFQLLVVTYVQNHE